MQMHTDESILPGSRNIKFFALCFPGLAVLYALSIGPAIKLTDCGIIGAREGGVLKVVYAPLALLAPIPGTKALFNWYVFHVWNCDAMGDNSL
jgi:hypothetical protein